MVNVECLTNDEVKAGLPCAGKFRMSPFIGPAQDLRAGCEVISPF